MNIPFRTHQLCPKCTNGWGMSRRDWTTMAWCGATTTDPEQLRLRCKCCGFYWFEHPADYVEPQRPPAPPTFEEQAKQEVEALLQQV